jgi:FKBP-type peptidyl-prolyl cis-trans isomerase
VLFSKIKYNINCQKLSLLLLLFLLFSCNKNKYAVFDKNYSYHLIHKSKFTETIGKETVIIYQMKLAKSNDSIFWDSKYFTEKTYCSYYNSKNEADKNSFEKLISNLFSMKDSIEIKSNAHALFKDFFKSPIPFFLKPNDAIKATLFIDTVVFDYDEVAVQLLLSTKKNKMEDEKNAIINYINKSKNIYSKIGKLYLSTIEKGQAQVIKKGDNISIKYNGYFLDGTNCDNSGSKSVDFEYGEQSQLLPGLMKAIAASKFDDSISVIIPSALAYGEAGSSTGFIKPFTPLRYEVRIRQTK